jgi:2-keto-4-pentenoate hydratase/2-oxohepta-3-ene-1,7-dioic acid hydratase in catechol pathway
MRIIRFLDEHAQPTLGDDLGDGTALELIDKSRILYANAVADPLTCAAEAVNLVSGSRRCKIMQLLAPIVPTDVVCIGRNYVRTGDDPEAIRCQELEVFLKPRSAIVGPGAEMRVPSIAGVEPDAHAEGELVVVIGRRMRDVTPEAALDHVLGFTLANDVTARHWSTPTGSPLWMRGKGFDTFCPLGPAIVSTSAIDDLRNMRIETRINGTLAMSSPLAHMARSVEAALSELSSRMTLHPGTIVLTGGPPLIAGIAPTTTLLTRGVRVDISAEPIGTLTNTVAV